MQLVSVPLAYIIVLLYPYITILVYILTQTMDIVYLWYFSLMLADAGEESHLFHYCVTQSDSVNFLLCIVLLE